MAGLPDLLVELDDGTGTFPHDITEFAHLSSGYAVARGRGSEFDSIDPSTLSITLNNSQGHFTLGSPTYGIFVDQMIRVSLSLDGVTWVPRFTGFVQNWPVTWASAQASLSLSTVTAVDRLARLERRQLRSMLEQEILADAPLAYFTLSEGSGSSTGGDTSGNRAEPLGSVGSGASVVFGGNTSAPLDGVPAAEFAAGQYLQYGPVPGAPNVWALEFWVQRSGNPAFLEVAATANRAGTGPLRGLAVLIGATGVVLVTGGGISTISSSAVVTDGSPHHILLYCVGPAVALYVDGAVQGASLVTPGTETLYSVTIGGDGSAFGLAGMVSNVAVLASTLTLPRIQARVAAAAGFAGDSSDERLGRLADYANIDAGDRDFQPGVLLNTAGQSTGGIGVMAAMAEVAAAEGGALFIDGSGVLVFQNRVHRVRSATGAAALSLAAGDAGADLTWSADKNYLTNYVTGSRPDGAEQTAVNQDSIDTHEQYPTSMSLLVTTDGEVAHAAQWQVGVYGEVQPRVTQVTVDLLTQPDDATREDALDLELGDRLTISGMPPQAPLATADLIVEGWTETYSKDAWSLQLNTVSADNFRAWVLEDPVYGALEGPFTRLHY